MGIARRSLRIGSVIAILSLGAFLLLPESRGTCAECADDFEDGFINPLDWIVQGQKGGIGGPGAGAWSWELVEVLGPDGYLMARTYGPTSAISLCGTALIRTVRDFHDGNDWLINFRWEATNQGALPWHADYHIIEITDGRIDWTNGIYLHPDGTILPGTTWLYMQNGRTVGPATWSIAIEAATATARLYDGPNGTGSRFATATLDTSVPWYLRFVATSGTSAGYPAKDLSVRLYDFEAKITSPQVILQEVETSSCEPAVVEVLINAHELSWEAITLGIRFPRDIIQAMAVAYSGVLSQVRYGLGPEFWMTSTAAFSDDSPDEAYYVTIAEINSTADPAGNAIPPSVEPQEIAKITFMPRAGAAVGMECALELVDDLRPGPNTEPTVCVLTVDGKSVKPVKVNGKVRIASRCFQRGDCNVDGAFDISDPVNLLSYLFLGNGGILSCRESCNAADDQDLDITDAIRMLNRLFLGAEPLPAPYKMCGSDPTAPSLECNVYDYCAI